MAMAFLEEEVDEGLFDEVLQAAMDAIRQKNQQHRQFLHPPPLLSSTVPQKKLAITHLPPSKSEDLKPPSLPSAVAPAHKQCAGLKKEVVFVTKCPQISSVNNYQSSHNVHRDASISSRDLNQQGFVKNVGGARNWSGPRGPDVKANGYLKTEGAIFSSGGGRGDDVKQEVYPRTGDPASAAWSGTRPFQELQPYVGSHEILERASSTSTWVQAAKTSCSAKENDVAWFAGLSGVAVFKECQEAAMRTLLPSDYTMMNGKPFIKKTDRGVSPIPGVLVIEVKRDLASQIMTFLAQLKQEPKPGHAKTCSGSENINQTAANEDSDVSFRLGLLSCSEIPCPPCSFEHTQLVAAVASSYQLAECLNLGFWDAKSRCSLDP